MGPTANEKTGSLRQIMRGDAIHRLSTYIEGGEPYNPQDLQAIDMMLRITAPMEADGHLDNDHMGCGEKMAGKVVALRVARNPEEG